MDEENDDTSLALLDVEGAAPLPTILAGNDTPDIRRRVSKFYASVAEIFEAWVARRTSAHTQRAYRQDLKAFIRFMQVRWPEDSWKLLGVSVSDVQGWRDYMVALDAAPKTLNRRVSSLSSFYKYLGAAAADLRLPIVVPNPAHAQFIAREATDPVEETKALNITCARKLMAMPDGDSVLDARDRAIVRFYLYTGARLATGCRLRVEDFHQDSSGEYTIRLHEKGNRRRTVGLNVNAGEAIAHYLQQAGITSGPLFRSRLNPRSRKLGARGLAPLTMYRLLMRHLVRLPRAMKDCQLQDGTIVSHCIYTPHSLRATTATLLLDAGVDILKVQELLGHRHVTTTQIYDKRRRLTSESASHEVPI